MRAVFFLSERRENIFAVAADVEQGAILFDDIKRMTLEDKATANLAKITGREMVLKEPPFSTLKVMAHSAPTVMGIRPTMICIDELGEWRGRAMFDALYSASGKVSGCRIAIISVPPVAGAAVLAEIMNIAKRDTTGRWFFSHRSQCAGWVDKAWLADQRATLPLHVYKRLHEAVQTEGAGAWLMQEEIDGVFQPMPEGVRGPYAIGVDIGVTRDRSFISALQKDESTGLFCVRHLLGFIPRTGERVNLQDVEQDVAAAARLYHAPVYLDPYQAVLMSQRLQQNGINVFEITFTAESRKKLFGTMLDVIRRKQLRCAPDPEFKAELTGLEIKESLTGYRVDHTSAAHDDATVAVALALQGLTQMEPVDAMPEAIGLRDTAFLGKGNDWITMPTPSEGGGVSVIGGGPGIDWDNIKW